MDTVRALRQVAIFKDVAVPVLEIVARATEEITVPAGETIVSAAEATNVLFVIRSGTLRAVLEDGTTPPLLFGAGETIGEVPFMDGEPPRGTVTALERVDLLAIRSGRLAEELASHPEAGHHFYRAIARALAGRLRRAVSMLAFASAREARR